MRQSTSSQHKAYTNTNTKPHTAHTHTDHIRNKNDDPAVVDCRLSVCIYIDWCVNKVKFMSSISTRKAYNVLYCVEWYPFNESHSSNHWWMVKGIWKLYSNDAMCDERWAYSDIRNTTEIWLRIPTTNNRTSGSNFYFIFFFSTIFTVPWNDDWKRASLAFEYFCLHTFLALNIQISKIWKLFNNNFLFCLVRFHCFE